MERLGKTSVKFSSDMEYLDEQLEFYRELVREHGERVRPRVVKTLRKARMILERAISEAWTASVFSINQGFLRWLSFKLNSTGIANKLHEAVAKVKGDLKNLPEIMAEEGKAKRLILENVFLQPISTRIPNNDDLYVSIQGVKTEVLKAVEDCAPDGCQIVLLYKSLYSERGHFRKCFYSRMEDIASSSATNSIPRLQQINDSIYIFHETPNPKVEVFFFHDLNWRLYEQPHIQSWMSSDSMPSVCWPVDLLLAKYPEAQILLANYDAGPWKTNTDGRMRLNTIAENFLHDILSIYTKDCPLVLVGHGLGGLVIKELVRSLQRERDEVERRLHAHQHSADNKKLLKLDSLLRNVRGALFFAPPFLGSGLIDYTKSNLRGSLLKYMEVMDTHTAELNEWFRRWRQDRPQDSLCKVTTISAGLPTEVDLPTEVALWYQHLTTDIVKEGSARPDADSFYTSRANHFNVCKLRHEKDTSFRMLTELIGPII